MITFTTLLTILTQVCSIICEEYLDNSIDISFSYAAEYPWNFSLLEEHLQSPVDVITSMAVKQRFEPLYFEAVNNKDIVCVIKNSGHGVTIQLESSDEELKPKLHGSFLTDKYLFENLHFHWGKEDYFGSEHFVNGESFSMEGHMVMYKKEYGDINKALLFKDGVVVLTYFGQVGKENEYLDKLLRYIPSVTNHTSDGVKALSANSLLWFLPGVTEANEKGDYYAYPGSLTTPPFTESVTFIILPEPISVSHTQLSQLRQLENSNAKPTKTNRRELQPLRGRPLIQASKIYWDVTTNNGTNNSISNSYLEENNLSNEITSNHL